jgi:hypothetical protein
VYDLCLSCFGHILSLLSSTYLIYAIICCSISMGYICVCSICCMYVSTSTEHTYKFVKLYCDGNSVIVCKIMQQDA